MSIDALQSLIPAYGQDLSRNLTVLLAETLLSPQQKWGTFLASAYAVGVPQVVRNLEAAASGVLSPEAVNAAKTASAIMAMNNVYYRALHLMENREYQTLRSGLRMNLLTNWTSSCGHWPYLPSMAAPCAWTVTKRCCAITAFRMSRSRQPYV